MITCTHLNDVLGSLAVGGLLGDFLFFFISGYCYGKGISKNFGEWYIQRWEKLYPPVLLMLIVNYFAGLWEWPFPDLHSITLGNVFSTFILPTSFIFFGAIIILYIPMFIYVNSKNKYRYIGAGITFLAYILYYVFCVDHRSYSMNSTGHVTILFVYFIAVILGVESFYWNGFLLKVGKNLWRKIVLGIWCVLSALAYTYFNFFFRRGENVDWLKWQILVPISLLITCTLFANFVLAFEPQINRLPKQLMKVIGFIADLTLEIYVVQLLIIKHLSGVPFPLNLFLILAAIILAAWILKKICTHMMSVLKQFLELLRI